jgi:hypothetical protein
MTAWLTRRRLPLAGSLAFVAVVVSALAMLGHASAAPAETQKRPIGAAVSNGFRVRVTAIRVPQDGSAPDTATVRIAAFRRSGGSWERLGDSLIVGQPAGWFWNVVTQPYGVRLLALHRPGASSRAGLRSGCSCRPPSGPPARSGSRSTVGASCRWTSSAAAPGRIEVACLSSGELRASLTAH